MWNNELSHLIIFTDNIFYKVTIYVHLTPVFVLLILLYCALQLILLDSHCLDEA